MLAARAAAAALASSAAAPGARLPLVGNPESFRLGIPGSPGNPGNPGIPGIPAAAAAGERAADWVERSVSQVPLLLVLPTLEQRCCCCC